jgi:hypothetical protein
MSMLFAVGCYTEADVGYGGPGYYGGPAPAMEVVTPGVQVVAVDYDYPVFYSSGLYWRFYGGTWYSSRYHTGGWAVNYNVPVGVRGIDRPYEYAHYRGRAGYGGGPAYRGGPAPAYRGNGGVEVRDHRAPAAAAPAYRQAPARGPVVRDHRR